MKRCVPCEGGTQPLTGDEADFILHDSGLDTAGWRRGDGRIERDYRAMDFRAAIAFVDEIAELAESENHHPDIRVHGYRNVTITLSTHALKGLSENDFIVAAKTERIWSKAA